MAVEWYYVKDSERLGPVAAAQLKQLVQNGQLTGQDLIWKEGLKNWIAVATVPQLAQIIAAQPPQSHITATPPQIPEEPILEEAEPIREGEPPRRRRRPRYDDEEYYDEEPVRRRKKKRKKKKKRRTEPGEILGMSVFTVVLLGIGAFGLLLGGIGFAVESVATAAAVLGSILNLVGAIWFLIIAFQDDALAGVLCLCVPFYSLYYLITHFDETKHAFFVQITGVVIAVMGSCAGAMHEGPRRRQPGRPFGVAVEQRQIFAAELCRLGDLSSQLN